MLNAIVSLPVLPLASRIAWRNEPGPASSVFVTVKVERSWRPSRTSTARKADGMRWQQSAERTDRQAVKRNQLGSMAGILLNETRGRFSRLTELNGKRLTQRVSECFFQGKVRGCLCGDPAASTLSKRRCLPIGSNR